MPNKRTISFKLDNDRVLLAVEPRALLSDVLREKCRRNRVHVGCEQGVCGSCTVFVDGDAVRSCLALAVEMEGRAIVTFDGLSFDSVMRSVMTAVFEHGGLQCGYCTPGMALAIYTGLRDEALPDNADDAREFLEGHLCRCTGYDGLVQAIVALSAEHASTMSREAGAVL